MKKRRHSSSILQFAANLASRESGFIFALVGVLVQASHTWFISFELSSFTGFLRLMQAGLMAFFLSAALLYFTLKSSDDDSDTARRYRKIVWWFALIECFINLYYWGYHLLVEPWPNADWSRFIIAVPFSILLPFTLKAYSSEVRTDDYGDEEDEKKSETDVDDKEYEEIIKESMNHVHRYDRSDADRNDKNWETDGIEPESTGTGSEPGESRSEPGEQVQEDTEVSEDTNPRTDVQHVEKVAEQTEGLTDPTPEPEPEPEPTPPTPEPEPDLYKYRSQNNL